MNAGGSRGPKARASGSRQCGRGGSGTLPTWRRGHASEAPGNAGDDLGGRPRSRQHFPDRPRT
eukprot:365245-Chlamydomonas_euryale.AAC.2